MTTAQPALEVLIFSASHRTGSLAAAAKHYPCMKRAWVEFLGEPPGMPADRVDA